MHYTTRFIAKHVRCRLFRCLVQNGQFLPPRLQTSQIPSKDQYQNTRAQILARMDVEIEKKRLSDAEQRLAGCREKFDRDYPKTKRQAAAGN